MLQTLARGIPGSDSAIDDRGLLYVSHSPGEQRHSLPHQSPSLTRDASVQRRAYELKFLLTASQGSEVEFRLANHMTVDPHANPALGNAYRISTLYCDTQHWDVFHKRGRFKLIKLRLRRYDQSSDVFLERKARRKNCVRKLRSSIALDDLQGLSQAALSVAGPCGAYYRQLK